MSDKPDKDDSQQFKAVRNYLGDLAGRLMPYTVLALLGLGIEMRVTLAQNGYEEHRDRMLTEEVDPRFRDLPPPDWKDRITSLEDKVDAVLVEQAEFRGVTETNLEHIQLSINQLLAD